MCTKPKKNTLNRLLTRLLQSIVIMCASLLSVRDTKQVKPVDPCVTCCRLYSTLCLCLCLTVETTQKPNPIGCAAHQQPHERSHVGSPNNFLSTFKASRVSSSRLHLLLLCSANSGKAAPFAFSFALAVFLCYCYCYYYRYHRNSKSCVSINA